MKLKIVLFVLLAVSLNAQSVSTLDIANYTNNWHYLYADSLSATTSEDTLVLPSGQIYNISITARVDTVLFKTTKATAYQGNWIMLLKDETFSYTGNSIDSLFFKAKSTTSSITVQWTKY